MTRLDMVYKYFINLDLLMTPEEAINGACPGVFDEDWPAYNAETAQKEGANITGCRGITCQECWNQEAANDQA